MRNLFFVALAALIVVSTASAQQIDPEAPKSLLQEKINEVLDILEKQDLSNDEKENQVEQAVDPVFDYELMGKLALGSRNWRKLSEDQRQVYTERFVERLKKSYADKITLYQGDADAKVDFGDPRTEKNKVHIPVAVTAKGDTANMVYKMYQSGGDWKIYDVEIGGVSIVQSYRTQFNQVLASGTVEDLLKELEKIKPPQN